MAESQENTVTKADLLIRHYKERLLEQEDKIAELRVELTVMGMNLQRLQSEKANEGDKNVEENS